MGPTAATAALGKSALANCWSSCCCFLISWGYSMTWAATWDISPMGLKKHRAPGKSGNGKWWMNPSNNPPETKLSSSNPKHLEPWRLFIYRMDPTGASHFQIHSEPYPSKQMFPKLLLLSLHFFSQSSGTKIFDQPLSVYPETSTTMGPWVKITDRVRTLKVLWGFVSLSFIILIMVPRVIIHF